MVEMLGDAVFVKGAGFEVDLDGFGEVEVDVVAPVSPPFCTQDVSSVSESGVFVGADQVTELQLDGVFL